MLPPDERRTIRTRMPTPLASELDGLVGVVLPAHEPTPGGPVVRLRIERLLGRGTLGVTFAATRIEPDGARPVALKVVRPSLVRAAESLALPSPFAADRGDLVRLGEAYPLPLARLVRALDEGVFPAGACTILEHAAPWIALELVEAPSLFARVRGAMAAHGVPLDAATTLGVLGDLAQALDELHRGGLVHRGLHPHQVLVPRVGPGGRPRARLTDLAIARPAGIPASFGLHPADDEGSVEPYSAPEQAEPGWRAAASLDVFAFARLVRFALSGRAPVRSIEHDLGDPQALHPDFTRGARLDRVRDALARGEAFDPAQRPPTAGALLALVREGLAEARRPSVPPRRSVPPAAVDAMAARDATRDAASGAPWVWSLRHRPTPRLELGRASLDEDGGGVALVEAGALGFDGARWRPLMLDFPRSALYEVSSLGASRFALSGADGRVAAIDALGSRMLTAGGALDALAVAEDGPRLLLIGRARAGLSLYVRDEGEWRAPLPLDGASDVCGLARLDGLGWVLAGATLTGAGYLAAYDDRAHVVRGQPPVGRVALRALSSGGRGLAAAVGAHGHAVSIERFADSPTRLRAAVEPTETPHGLFATLVDADGEAWAAGEGVVLRRRASDAGACWTVAWRDPDLPLPIRGLARAGRSLLVLLADGTVIEGRPLAREG
jgi:serine/threonine protein kinase